MTVIERRLVCGVYLLIALLRKTEESWTGKTSDKLITSERDVFGWSILCRYTMAPVARLVTLVVVVVCVGGVLSQTPPPSGCPIVPVIRNFNIHQYLGRWYEIERFFNPFQSGDCVTADYDLLPNGSVSVVNTQLVKGRLDSLSGIGTPGPDPTEGKLVVNFPDSPVGSFTTDGLPNYNVVITDYVNYAVVYSCVSFAPGSNYEFSWILSRYPTVPQNFLNQLKEWLKAVNVDSSQYMPTKQEYWCPRRPL
ncbi:apolipoprotein D-like isoform X3 [Procambarus clarkii]|uniref:apolipoprotein D isoform X4 n=1 Tax=Procambarus clarkii TaxID=6728 RepID=UPI003742BE6E